MVFTVSACNKEDVAEEALINIENERIRYRERTNSHIKKKVIYFGLYFGIYIYALAVQPCNPISIPHNSTVPA